MIRGIGLRSGVAINVASIVGVGPLITIPLVVAAQNGSPSVWPWIAGAAIALCDGLVNAELASRFPRSGGTYAYLREAFGPHGAGRLCAFLFVWAYLFAAPLTLASGYIGFAQYAAYLVPGLAPPLAQHAVAIAVGVGVIASLYRTIPRIARTALVLGAVALCTLLAVAASGFAHPAQHLATLVPAMLATHGIGVGAFGAALVITLYDYAGYTAACQLGDEVVAPARTIPRAIVISIVLVALAYVALNAGVFSALSLHDIAGSTSVASLAVERTSGPLAAQVVTVAILVTAFASTYGLLLSASRVPYAAAVDGDFLPAFARLHPTKQFPNVSLLALGLLALPATLVPLDQVINALTAAIVLVQGAGGVLAVMRLRATAAPAPFRAPLYPLPALVALAAWIFLFCSSGANAMLFGAVMLAAGAAIFLVRARRSRAWPFVLAALVVFALAAPRAASAETFTHARVVEREGTPQLLVDGRPFFFFAGAFFYERIPPERWRAAMLAMRALGANTLDLYVPWNWHEVADGTFDFDGRTNPRRNLREVLRLARELGFHLIVRPGPVIRNEWRNGGYPAWLLEQPAYGMPLHDVLEGRYPATATLQNAHSDDAAAQWLANPVHLDRASTWLHAALREFVPYADLVLAVALDDDQGAYIDNQTWPAPHLQTYLTWLQAQVHDVTGPSLPTFINTYDMKVPASAPVWAMGNWYQSDAYAIGDHDRIELDFATGTLTTQEHVPLGISEFQAGWLAAPEDPQPRAADPANTTLALAEMLAWGAHGVVDFPLQDTLAPFGWEAPFSNAFYNWDAAIARDPLPHAEPGRWAPTRSFGDLVTTYGPLLAQTHRVADIAIADEVSAASPSDLTNDDVAAIAAHLKDELRACNDRGLTCDVVDLRYASDARLRRYDILVVPPFVRAPDASIAARLAQLRAKRRVVAHVPNERGTGITVLSGPSVSFGIAVNWSDGDRSYAGPVTVDGKPVRIAPFVLSARSARLFVVRGSPVMPRAPDLTADPPTPPPAMRTYLSRDQSVDVDVPAVAAGEASATIGHAFGSGDETVVLANDRAYAVLVPGGGARLVAFGPREAGARGITNATGALRDDVLLQPPPSATDRIAKYTHSYPAGTFNRDYHADIVRARGTAAVVRFTYDAPDVLPAGAHFVKTVSLAAGATRLVIDERVTFDGDATGQRAVTHSAIAVDPSAVLATSPNFCAFAGGLAISVAWSPGALDRADWTPYGTNGSLTLVSSRGTLRTTYAFAQVSSAPEARAFAQAERDWLAKNP